MKTLSENRMGAVVQVGAGKDAPTLKLTPAGVRAIATFPVKDRDKVLLAADKTRVETGHPKQADKTVNAIWDDHIALSQGVKADGIAEWRKERGLPRPAVA